METKKIQAKIDEASAKAGKVAVATGAKATEVARVAKDLAANATGKIEKVAAEVAHAAQEIAHKVVDTAKEKAAKVGEETRRVEKGRVMNTEQGHVDANHHPNDATVGHATGSESPRRRDFGGRTMAAAAGLRLQAREHIRHDPYSAMCVACVVGLGVGVVLSSRILRAVLSGALTGAAVEVARGLVRQNLLRREAA